MTDEIIYCYQKGSGWVPQYKWLLDAAEEISKEMSEAISRYLRAGVITPEEVWRTPRFAGATL